VEDPLATLLVTVMSTVSAPAFGDAGVTAEMDVSELTTQEAGGNAAFVPSVKETLEVQFALPMLLNPVPTICTEVPPVAGPLLGVTELTVGVTVAAEAAVAPMSGTTKPPRVATAVTADRRLRVLLLMSSFRW
jgi:hypothetical protein